MEKTEGIYYLTYANMYLHLIETDANYPENEFISKLTFTASFWDKYELFSRGEAQALANKIYIALGIECEIKEG